MSCILRVSGDMLDIDALISAHDLVANRIWRKGELRSAKGKIHANSRANFTASSADLDQFETQLDDAIRFLENNITEISKIASFPDVENATLDFGVVRQDVFVECTYLPPNFLKLVAKAGIGVEISHYVNGGDDKD